MTETHQTLSSNKMRAAKPAAPRFATFADLLRSAYDGKSKRITLARTDIESMQSGPIPEGELREALLRLASSDCTLERSRELVLLGVEKLERHPLAAKLRHFVGDVLRRHPAYQLPTLDGVLENKPEAAPIDVAVKAVTGQAFAQIRWPDGFPPLKKIQIETLRYTAGHCLLIWLRETRGIPLDRILYMLHAFCWAAPERRTGSDATHLRILMSSRDRKALDVVFSALEKKANEKSREVAAAREAEERARLRVELTQASLDEANYLLESEKSRTTALEEQLQRERREYEDQKAYLRSDYEELRGRVLHRLRQEVTLLDEGLHALRRQPPKVHVMEDHAERAIDGLKKEIARIKGEAE